MVFNQGDIIHLSLNPTKGFEIQDGKRGGRYAFVVSPKDFNQLGLTMLCPISAGEVAKYRNGGFLVSLSGTGLKTDGSILVHQARIIDTASRGAKFCEKAPPEIYDAVYDILCNIISPQ
jgi:mRNA interferase ChpB